MPVLSAKPWITAEPSAKITRVLTAARGSSFPPGERTTMTSQTGSGMTAETGKTRAETWRDVDALVTGVGVRFGVWVFPTRGTEVGDEPLAKIRKVAEADSRRKPADTVTATTAVPVSASRGTVTDTEARPRVSVRRGARLRRDPESKEYVREITTWARAMGFPARSSAVTDMVCS